MKKFEEGRPLRMRKYFSAILFLLCFFAFSTTWAGDLWGPVDSDTSLGHLPEKIFDDLPHLLVPDNILILSIGTVGTTVDWSVFDKGHL